MSYKLLVGNVLFSNELTGQQNRNKFFPQNTEVEVVRNLEAHETSAQEQYVKIKTTDSEGDWYAYVRLSDLEQL